MFFDSSKSIKIIALRWKQLLLILFNVIYKRSNEDLTSMWHFGTYHILAKASINCPCWRSGASCLNSGLHLYLVYAGSKGSCESTHLHRLTRAFISWNCDKYQNQVCWLIWFILCVTSYNLLSLVWIMQMIRRCNFVTMIIDSFGILNTNKTKFNCKTKYDWQK